eukprot:scaffold3821_cov134-Isochrysis_galbana.AAC.10
MRDGHRGGAGAAPARPRPPRPPQAPACALQTAYATLGERTLHRAAAPLRPRIARRRRRRRVAFRRRRIPMPRTAVGWSAGRRPSSQRRRDTCRRRGGRPPRAAPGPGTLG